VKVYKKIADIFLSVYSAVGLIALALVIICTFLQVLMRYVLPGSLTWTEEGARYAFIWTSMMGASLASRHCSNASIDFLESLFKGKTRIVHFVILHICILAIAVLIFPYGLKMVSQMMMRSSSALGIPMGFVYLAIPIGCLGIIVQEIYNILEKCFGKAQNMVEEV